MQTVVPLQHLLTHIDLVGDEELRMTGRSAHFLYSQFARTHTEETGACLTFTLALVKKFGVMSISS